MSRQNSLPKLLISSNHDIIEEYLEDFNAVEQTRLGQDNLPIKIEVIRHLKQKIFFKSSLQKLIIIYNGQNLTESSQNSLLKLLEEPPENTLIILICPNENLLLATIVSRCEIVRLNPKSQIKNPKPASPAGGQIQNSKLKNHNKTDNLTTDKQISENRKPRTENRDFRVNQQSISVNPNLDLAALAKLDIGQKFKLVEELIRKENKDQSLEEIRNRVEKWLKESIASRQSVIANDNMYATYHKFISLTFACQKQIHQNLNLRLILENYLLNLVEK